MDVLAVRELSYSDESGNNSPLLLTIFTQGPLWPLRRERTRSHSLARAVPTNA
jgi:hypothetical protein